MRNFLKITLAMLLVSLQATCLPAAEREQAGDDYARRAVVAGMRGDVAKKQDLLSIALQTNPENRLANWGLGNVQVKGEWLSSREYESTMKDDPLLETYRQYRDSARAGRISELELATWCRSKGIGDAEKVHLNNVLASDDATVQQKAIAVQRLGLQNVGGTWMTPKEMANFRSEIGEARSNHAKWAPVVGKLMRSLDGAGAARKKYLWSRFRSTLDASAITTLELLLSNQSESAAKVSVRLIATQPDWEATESLVRHAVQCRWPSVRSQAIESLSMREMHDVVPQLLAVLANPLEARYGIGVGADGMVRSGRYVYQEGREANTLFADVSARGPHRINVLEVDIRPRDGFVRPVRNSDDLLVERMLERWPDASWEERVELELEIRSQIALARRNIIQQEIQRSLGVSRRVGLQNLRTAEQNERATIALKQITGADLDSDTPSDWWDWWNQQNERFQPEKPTITEFASYSDPSVVRRRRFSCECFPAGTVVRTQQGNVAIEKILPGDRALSRHTETGELSYKIITGTTKRPPSSMVRIRFADGSVESTSGHLFWVEEHGWKMAKNLQPNDRLHSLDSNIEVVAVEEIEDAIAYNLVVADFGTYFVSDHEIMVHDNSERRRTRAISPGLIGVNP